MKGLDMKRNMTITGMVCCALWFTACVSTAHMESQVEERAMGRWNALLSGDLAGAYEYFTPGYRSSVSSLNYQRSVLTNKVIWKSAEYVESKCEDKVCNVKISLGFVIYAALPGVSSYEDTDVVDESWILIDGEWYFAPTQ